MNLRDYLFEHGIQQEDFAETVEVSRSHLSSIITGSRNPSKRLARRIERATNGCITAEGCLVGDALGYEGKSRCVTKDRKKVSADNRKVLSLI